MTDNLKEKLSPLAWHVTQEKGTEAPYTGKFDDFDVAGDYHCLCCNQYLFSSQHKFQSSCGWPAFFQAIDASTHETRDFSHGMNRIEITCSGCNAHLGHKFPDGPHGTRYCINSVALTFAEQSDKS